MTIHEILRDIHSLEEELLDFERKYGLRSETFYTAYSSGEEPGDDRWVLDFSEWASVYRTWLALYWYDPQPHPNDPSLQSTHPHHKHVPPDIKHNRIPAPNMSFNRPNLPGLIQEIEDLAKN